jgi:hypothetical protein
MPLSAPYHQQQQGRGQRVSGGSSGSARKPGRRGQYYQEHLPSHLLQQGLKSGGIFRAVFRTNPSDRTQGYCSLAGLPTDVFVRVRTHGGGPATAQPNCWLSCVPACC